MRFPDRGSATSMLALGALGRVAIAVVALTILWLAIAWSVSLA